MNTTHHTHSCVHDTVSSVGANNFGMNDRIKRLRRQTFEAQPSLSIERALIETRFYRENYGKYPIPILRALNFLEICKQTGCRLSILPGLYQLINSEVTVSALREVEIEDLLGREPVKANLPSIMSYVKDRVVFVTGGGGSIGSEMQTDCKISAEEVSDH